MAAVTHCSEPTPQRNLRSGEFRGQTTGTPPVTSPQCVNSAGKCGSVPSGVLALRLNKKRPHSYFPFAVVARGPVEIRRNMIPIPLSVRAGVNLGVALRFRT